MILITSAAYIEPELQSEFGALPPAFLPVGNKRLFYRQIESFPAGEKIVLTLPAGFEPGPYDSEYLANKKVHILELPRHLRLGEAVVYALNLLEFDDGESLSILHGDTLIQDAFLQEDSIGVSQVEDNYSWAEYDMASGLLSKDSVGLKEKNLVANGSFNFTQPKKLIKQIVLANWDFIDGINGYHLEVGLKPDLQENWCDFGHNHTYYASKSRITTQRAFNEMRIIDGVVTKRSKKIEKLQGEACWYEKLPGRLKVYTPQLLEKKQLHDAYEYSIEYLHLTALNELFVFSQLPVFAWRKIINACCQFITDAKQYVSDTKAQKDEFDFLFVEKTNSRIQEYASIQGVEITNPVCFNGEVYPSLLDIAYESQRELPAPEGVQHVMHGDFCFSNILYDFRTGAIKVIDPRGVDVQGAATIYGNSYYDIAKLAHSILGLYDVIIAGYFSADMTQDKLHFELSVSMRREKIANLFVEIVQKQFGITEQQLYAMQIQLFLSMLPLHSDLPDRQIGFIGNAYRLYRKLKEIQS